MMRPLVPDRTKEEIRAEALRLGFAACGFSDAEPLDLAPLLEGWVSAGRHGHMDYLARDIGRRTSPRAVLPMAGSVVVLGWRYPAPPAPRADWQAELSGRIAAYALGRDYHRELGERAGILAATIEEACGGSTLVQVDAGPLVEKDLARRAGLGWYGYNTNLLSKSLGSYFLLACVLTEAHFEPDAPFTTTHCGDCRACVPACPTEALGAATIDARRCISYLTIEHRGPVDASLRPAIGNWVFGCDVCQEVCPWSPVETGASSWLEPYLPELLHLTHEEFDRRFGSTAVARAKRAGLARNAAIALGNTGNPSAVDPLISALRSHDEPIVRAHVAWALGRLGGREAKRALSSAAGREQVPPVRCEIDSAFAAAKAAEARENRCIVGKT